jgi:hypothetical protein
MKPIESICVLGATISSLEALRKKPYVSKKRLAEIVKMQREMLAFLEEFVIANR